MNLELPVALNPPNVCLADPGCSYAMELLRLHTHPAQLGLR